MMTSGAYVKCSLGRRGDGYDEWFEFDIYQSRTLLVHDLTESLYSCPFFTLLIRFLCLLICSFASHANLKTLKSIRPLRTAPPLRDPAAAPARPFSALGPLHHPPP